MKSHIKNISAYIENEKAMIPNAIVLAFSDPDVSFKKIESKKNTFGELGILRVPNHLNSDTRPAFIVDGQQRTKAIEMAKVMEPGAKVAKQVPFTKSLLKSQSKARAITQLDDVVKWKQMQDELLLLGEQKLKVSQKYKRALVLRETNEISEKEFLDIVKADKKLNKKLYELNRDVTTLHARVPDIEHLTKVVDRKGIFKVN